MQDYFDSGNGAGGDGDTAMATNGGGAVQAVANGGDQMEDEVMVSRPEMRGLARFLGGGEG